MVPIAAGAGSTSVAPETAGAGGSATLFGAGSNAAGTPSAPLAGAAGIAGAGSSSEPELPGCSSPAAGSTARVDVFTGQLVRAIPNRPFGINLNYLADDDANRSPGARPLKEALKDMGVRFLRYPGGEKSDAYFWSVPPFDRARPTVLRNNQWPYADPALVDQQTLEFVADPLDFDELMELVKFTGAEPVIVVCYDNIAKFAGTNVTIDSMLEAAVEWVRYANIERGYGIRYWEIGNEAWVAGGPDVATYAADVARFSKAMKAVDPTISIGASGVTWLNDWKTILPVAGYDMDLLIQPSYTGYGWGSYQYYVDHPNLNLVPEMDNAVKSLWYARESERERLQIGVPEVNSNDFMPPGWPKDNNLGHALVTFDTFLQLLSHEKISYAQLWNTRWWPELDAGGNPLPTAIWTALDEQNQILPSGRVLQILGQMLGEQLVRTSGETQGIVPYASFTPGSGALSVFLINKGADVQTVTLAVDGSDAGAGFIRHELTGQGPSDMNPTWGAMCQINANAAELSLELSPFSLTALELRK